MSDSVQHHRQQSSSLPCPWDSPGKNTGVGCHFLLQCMKVKSESEVAQSCQLCATPRTAAPQAPPSMGFSRQEYWSGVPLPSPLFYVDRGRYFSFFFNYPFILILLLYNFKYYNFFFLCFGLNCYLFCFVFNINLFI